VKTKSASVFWKWIQIEEQFSSIKMVTVMMLIVA